MRMMMTIIMIYGVVSTMEHHLQNNFRDSQIEISSASPKTYNTVTNHLAIVSSIAVLDNIIQSDLVLIIFTMENCNIWVLVISNQTPVISFVYKRNCITSQTGTKYKYIIKSLENAQFQYKDCLSLKPGLENNELIEPSNTGFGRSFNRSKYLASQTRREDRTRNRNYIQSNMQYLENTVLKRKYFLQVESSSTGNMGCSEKHELIGQSSTIFGRKFQVSNLRGLIFLLTTILVSTIWILILSIWLQAGEPLLIEHVELFQQLKERNGDEFELLTKNCLIAPIEEQQHLQAETSMEFFSPYQKIRSFEADDFPENKVDLIEENYLGQQTKMKEGPLPLEKVLVPIIALSQNCSHKIGSILAPPQPLNKLDTLDVIPAGKLQLIDDDLNEENKEISPKLKVNLAIYEVLPLGSSQSLIQNTGSLLVPPPPPAAPALNLIASTSNCRMFHWEAMKKPNGNSIWSDLAGFETKIDTNMLESQFGKTLRSATKESSQPTGHNDKEKLLKLPDSRKSQNMEIMLRKLPKIPILHKAILNLDDSIFTGEIFELVFQNIPSAEDLEFISCLGDIDENLAEAPVLYIKMLHSIPNWEERLQTWKLFKEFDDRYNDICENISQYQTTLDEVKGMKSLQQILAVILCCGNQMNRGSYRGNAQGFRLDSILKLSTTKMTVASQGSLLDYIVHQLNNTYPESTDFGVNMQISFNKVQKLSLALLHNGATNLAKEVRRLSSICDEVASKLDPNDKYLKIRDSFGKFVKNMETVELQIQQLQQRCQDILEYFGLSLKVAKKMFQELYPVNLNSQKKKDQLLKAEKTEWTNNDEVKINEVVKGAFQARKSHLESKSNEELKKARQKRVTDAKKSFQHWIGQFDLDSEILKETNESVSDDFQILSDCTTNLLRMLAEFAIQFNESLARLH